VVQILIPTQSAEDWKRLLAKPDLHWKEGYSAMTLANCWEAAARAGDFPPEIKTILATANQSSWESLRLLLAIPEYQVPLPGGSRPSQTDLLVLARSKAGLIAIAVEGKVDESLGPTLGEKRAENSTGVNTRIDYLLKTLGLSECADGIRYQLLHRTASALIVANDYAANAAIMIVHSFSPTEMWFADFAAFAALFGRKPETNRLIHLGDRDGIPLWIGWCVGDQKFRTTQS
jgi:hypothetical protein